MAMAHHMVVVDVIGAQSTAWVLGQHYLSEDDVGARAACKLAREEAERRAVTLGRVSARFASGRWEVTAEAAGGSNHDNGERKDALG